MILQALTEYYDRKSADPEGGMAPEGWIVGGIDYIIEIDSQGGVSGVESLQEIEGNRRRPKQMLVPDIGKQSLKHTNSGKDANLLWDNAAFVLGLGEKGDVRLKSMLQAIQTWFGETDDAEIKAVRRFLEKGLKDRHTFSGILQHPDYGDEIQQGSAKLTFRIKGTSHRVIFENPLVRDRLSHANEDADVGDQSATGVCLVSGEMNVTIEATHPVIKGVWGTQSSGATIVGFNKDSFLSYKKRQSLNAPVYKGVVSQYVKSLNYLLMSAQRMQVGDASTVFWSADKTQFEGDFAGFFTEAPKDDPSASTRRIRNLFDSVKTGAYLGDDGTQEFYILGLAPNAARIAVRFWERGTIAEFAGRIRQYFEDLRIVKPPHEPEFYSMWRLLVNVAVQDKSENIPPNIAGEFMRSILEGLPYPAVLLQAVLRRIRSDADGRVKPVRAALIKAYLNRYNRTFHEQNSKEIAMAIDLEQPSIGYQLGRLFAVLEKVQEEANPGINATIRDRYYGAACSAPVTVFSTLLRLKNHHLAKIENRGRVVNLERVIAEILGRVTDFPAHLTLHEQARFALGYYHQRQHLFEAKTKTA